MKKTIIYQSLCAILIAIVIVILYKQNNMEQKEQLPLSNKDAVLTVIHNRKSVRNFIPQKPVSKADLETLVRAGMAAPSAKNQQVWRFMVITERDILNSLSENLPWAKVLSKAGAAILVCADMDQVLEGPGAEFWIQDCSAASENILLAVEAMGLGAVWTGVYPYGFIGEDKVLKVKDLLKIPSSVNILNAIAIGYPVGNEEPKDKYKGEYIHWENW